MNIYEAMASCKEGNFITHKGFKLKESIHYHEGSLYYEDGRDITNTLRLLTSEEWYKDGWYVKFTKDNVDMDKLKRLHEISRGLMLRCSSYEECIKGVRL